MEVSTTTYGTRSGRQGRSARLRLWSDDRLITLIQAGDDAAFDALAARHHDRLLAFCRHLIDPVADAEPVLQEALSVAHRALQTGDRPIHVLSWLAWILHSRCQEPEGGVQAVGLDSANPAVSLLPCEQVRFELAEVAEGLLRRLHRPGRRHVSRCEPCRAFRVHLTGSNRALAALRPDPLALWREGWLPHLDRPAAVRLNVSRAGSPAPLGAGFGALATRTAIAVAAVSMITAGAAVVEHDAAPTRATQHALALGPAAPSPGPARPAGAVGTSAALARSAAETPLSIQRAAAHAVARRRTTAGSPPAGRPVATARVASSARSDPSGTVDGTPASNPSGPRSGAASSRGSRANGGDSGRPGADGTVVRVSDDLADVPFGPSPGSG